MINFEDIGNNNINYTIQRNLVRTRNNQNLFDLNISIETILNKNIKENRDVIKSQNMNLL